MTALIGVDVGGTKIEAIVMSADGAVLARERINTPVGNYQATLKAVAQLTQRVEGLANCKSLPIGMGIPGSISPHSGLVRNANSTCLNGQPFQADIERELGRKVVLANDANCLALSESRDGAGVDCESVFAVILGTGVGGALVVNGRLNSGRNRLRGEWGHNPLPWPDPDLGELPGRICWCGQPGCIESWLSGPALSQDYLERTERLITAEQLVAASECGDDTAFKCLDRYYDRLAKSLATVINLFDPEVVVLAGGVSQIDAIYTEVPRRWPRWVFSDAVSTPLRPAAHGDASGVRGAAYLALGAS